MNFDFIKGMKLVDNTGIRQPDQNTPKEDWTIRIFKNGSIYPSKNMVEAHDLSYRNEDNKKEGFGYDVVPSWKWTPTSGLQEKFIMIARSPRKENKIDMFFRTTYREDGTPAKNVLEQGSPCNELLDACKELGYFGEHTRYVDLKIHVETPINTQDGIYLLPKKIDKGEAKGQPTYVRRENITLFPVSSSFKRDAAPKVKKEKKEEVASVEANEVTIVNE